jgi:hypothetical protein
MVRLRSGSQGKVNPKKDGEVGQARYGNGASKGLRVTAVEYIERGGRD